MVKHRRLSESSAGAEPSEAIAYEALVAQIAEEDQRGEVLHWLACAVVAETWPVPRSLASFRVGQARACCPHCAARASHPVLPMRRISG